MAFIKSTITFVFLCFGMLNTPVMGQATTRSTLDFWLTVTELLTTDVLDRLGSVQLPNIQLPMLPNIQFPNIQFPNIQVPNVQIPDTRIPPFEYPVFHSHQPDYLPHVHFANQPHPHAVGMQMPARPTTPSATTTPKPDCDNCKPDKVKIIVVEDCDEKHEKSSSESCEDSDEVEIAVPYQKRSGYNYRKHSRH